MANKRENPLTAFMLVQQFNPEYFNWFTDEKKSIEEKNIQEIAKIIKEKLNTCEGFIDNIVEECHIINHDRDSITSWDELHQEYVLTPKEEHFHCLCRFKKNKGLTLSEIASALGVEPEYIEKPKRGKFAYDNMLAYLVHIKYQDKFQYSPKDVYSTDKSYNDYYSVRRQEWLRGRIAIKRQQSKLGVEELIERIKDGSVTRTQIMLTDELADIFLENKRRCEDALELYSERKILKTIKAMEDGKFKVTVYFITGQSGSGKSTFTDRCVLNLIDTVKQKSGEVWRVCSTASSNPFDDYGGEEILVMDDLRGMSLTASDWLKLLDPDRINMGSARYKNKKMACRAIFINSEKDVFEFFYFMKGNGGGDRSESMDQFFRRILARVKLIPYEDERRVELGYSQKVEPKLLKKPDSANYLHDRDRFLTVSRDFEKDKKEYGFDEAVGVITNDIISRNEDIKDNVGDIYKDLFDDEYVNTIIDEDWGFLFDEEHQEENVIREDEDT